MNDHSPAPWKILRSSDYTGDPADTQIMSIEAADGTVVLFTDSGYFKPRETDACLIAAAPELLKALEDLAECDLTDTNCASLEVASRRIRYIARTAIAKATGESAP